LSCFSPYSYERSVETVDWVMIGNWHGVSFGGFLCGLVGGGFAKVVVPVWRALGNGQWMDEWNGERRGVKL